jgi:hypothetical protein
LEETVVSMKNVLLELSHVDSFDASFCIKMTAELSSCDGDCEACKGQTLTIWPFPDRFANSRSTGLFGAITKGIFLANGMGHPNWLL